jgi:hypothetical protein
MNNAELFLYILGGKSHTFQTFNDKKDDKFKYLNKQFHGTLAEFRDKLTRWNSWGVGIFVTINQTNGKGRKAKNITKVRALLADLDGSPLAPILKAKPEPHMIIESSKGKYHAYWLVDDCPLDKFSMYQKAIARKFDSDPKVCDLPRVMRLPGFNHCKGKSYPVKVKWHNSLSPYFLEDIKDGLGLELELELELGQHNKPIVKSSSNTNNPAKKTVNNCCKASSIRFSDGRRNDDLFKVACAMRGRGESKGDIRAELLLLNQKCNPPLSEEEVLEIVDNVWGRY